MSSTSRLLRTTATLICTVATLTAATLELPLEFTRLDLTDGRKLRNVVVKSYDEKSGRLLVVADGKAMTIHVSLIPAPFRAQFRAETPKSGSTTSVTPAAPPAPRPSPPSPSKSAAYARPAGTSNPAAESAPPATLSRLPEHKAKAERHAVDEYRKVRTTSSNSGGAYWIETDSAQPMDGWPGHYRTTGRARLWTEPNGRNPVSEFDVVTEEKPDGTIAVVQFNRKN